MYYANGDSWSCVFFYDQWSRIVFGCLIYNCICIYIILFLLSLYREGTNEGERRTYRFRSSTAPTT